MKHGSPRVVAVALCLVALSIAAPAVATTGTEAPAAAGQTAQSGPALVQSDVDPDSVVMEATIREDGTADWAVEYRVRLDDDNATAAFESVQADIEENRSAFTDRFATGMSRTVRSAENATGREMGMRNVTVTADKQTLGQEYGVITYRFTWDGFAAVDGDRIRAGDALAGLFLDSETTLTMYHPDGYAVESVQPRPTENKSSGVVWRGPLDFGPNEPGLVVAPAGGGVLNTPLLAGAAVVLLALLAGGWLVASRRGDGTADESPTDGDRSGAVAAGETADADGPDAQSSDDGPDEELLSNEERVLRLLESEGGRIKQQEIAGEFDWTDAKTSQVVGKLRDDDAVETFRIGRENVVTLPEESDL